MNNETHEISSEEKKEKTKKKEKQSHAKTPNKDQSQNEKEHLLEKGGKSSTEKDILGNKMQDQAEKLTEKQLRKLEWDKKLSQEGKSKHCSKNEKETVQGLQAKTQKGQRLQNETKNSLHKKPLEGEIGTLNEKVQDQSEKLTEKQLRKLEWAKKLAEEKLKIGQKDETGTLNRAELKAKRREQQEAQRLLKVTTKNEPVVKSETKNKNEKSLANSVKQVASKKSLEKDIRIINKIHEVHLVKHLYIKDALKFHPSHTIHKDLHPSFAKLGIQFMHKTILGSNARCLALLAALKILVKDLETPPKQEFCRYMEVVLQLCSNYLQKCRPFAVSMTNALRYFKLQLTQIDTNQKDNEKKGKLIDIIDTYISNDIKKAGDAISIKVNEKITDGDVILTYGHSSLIRKILEEAHKDGKKFEVIIVDGKPLLEGKEMLRKLVVAGITCSYTLINAISYVMGRVTKVVLGAHALLTNGYVVSRIGTAQISLVAQAYNKPVLVCCETYKFSERVQTDSFVYNEIDDPNVLSTSHILNEPTSLSKWENVKMLTPLNLLYDVTPPDLVSAVVTEIAILPCTSVPVVLRINANEI